MKNPFLTRAAHRNKQPKAYWRSQKQERELSKRLGARLISGSGNGIKKGDLYIPGMIRVEAKTTQQSSFVLKMSMIETIEDAAMLCDEIPVIIIEFLDRSGNPIRETAVTQVQHLERLIAAVRSSSSLKSFDS
jgi:hypothetical protein